jgi:1-acyl-sn-glycerol-3-phosphate acyltransferase
MLSYSILATAKSLSTLLYRFETQWLSEERFEVCQQVRLLVLLNHTSLFEPLFLRIAPHQLIWRISQRLLIPVADTTLQRPIVGKLLRAIVPGIVAISRKRDDSWQQFLAHVKNDAMVAILPEGRMKRANGLDKEGKPMSVRGGIADLLSRMDDGKILFVYSGGLHHIQAPGESKLRLFKKIKVNLEMVDIARYKTAMHAEQRKQFILNVVADMDRRLRENVPHCEQQPCNKK